MTIRWKTLDRTVVYDGSPFLTVSRERVELPDGRILPDYHRIDIADAVVVLAGDAEDRLMVYREYRHGIGEEVLAMPAGRLTERETPEEAAIREFREETGYAAKKWTFLGDYVASASYYAFRDHFFAADEIFCAGQPTEIDYENPQIFWMSRDEVRAALRAGRFKILSAAMAAHLWLDHTEPRR